MGVAQHRRQPVSHVQPDAPNLAQIFGSPSQSAQNIFEPSHFSGRAPAKQLAADQKQTRSSPGTHTDIRRQTQIWKAYPPPRPIPSKIPKNFDGPMAFPPCL